MIVHDSHLAGGALLHQAGVDVAFIWAEGMHAWENLDPAFSHISTLLKFEFQK